MTKTITRLYDNRNDAMEAAHELERLGVPTQDVSIVASNKDSWYNANGADAHSGETKAGEGMAMGATTGGVLGAGAGLLAGLGMIAIPGIGPVVAAGWLAATAAGAATGLVAGGALGGLVGALTKAGVPEEDAHIYSEGVRRGGTLLSVRIADDRASEIESTLDRYRPTDVRSRGGEYRANGWTRFDADSPPPM